MRNAGTFFPLTSHLFHLTSSLVPLTSYLLPITYDQESLHSSSTRRQVQMTREIFVRLSSVAVNDG